MKSFLEFIACITEAKKLSKKSNRADRFNWNSGDLKSSKKSNRADRFNWNSGDLKSANKSLKEDKPAFAHNEIEHVPLNHDQWEHFASHRKSFTPIHEKFLRRYKEDSLELNDHLRRKTGMDNKNFTNAMDHITSQKTKHPMTVYRGFGAKFDHSTLTPGSIHKDHGFTGTSLNPKLSKEFSHQNTLAQIHVPAGTKGHHLDLEGHRMSHPSFSDYNGEGEHEFLLHRGSRFKVSHHSQHIDPKSGKEYKIVHMHVLPKKSKSKAADPRQMH